MSALHADAWPDRAQPLLSIRQLALHFGRQRTRDGAFKAVDNVSFDIQRGTTYSLVGESGSGKSTIGRCAVGLYTPTAGRVLFDGQPLDTLHSRRAALPVRRRIQMIFQDPYASLNPRWQVGDIIAEPLRTHGLASERRHAHRRVCALLEQVGLAATDADRYPHAFSGGQRQRVAIARALASQPDFIVCDEPTSALDVSVQAQILNLLAELQSALGLTYLFISHNLAVVLRMSHQVGVLHQGRLVESGSPTDILLRAQHPYTRQLVAAIPGHRPAADRQAA